jgi:hypothetical protein
MAETKRLDDAKAALTSCVSILAAVTGQPDAVLGKWLDLYYQIRRAYEIERGAEQDPRLLSKDDLYPVLRELLREALGEKPRRMPPPETVQPQAKTPGPWVKYKQRISAALREARARGVTMARIAENSGGVLTEHRVMDALNSAKLGQEEWRALDAALAVIEAESAADE